MFIGISVLAFMVVVLGMLMYAPSMVSDITEYGLLTILGSDPKGDNIN